ncbi:MAG TPA: hypothetical protein H9776_02225, partial [Candidatus Mediterraneibacter intestinipullorum]|nr:hypothetical protein [Candidatus Mediterraneibacter intestinipullorum]
LLLTCHQPDGIYKTKVKSLFFKPFTHSYHRRILFTDFSSQPRIRFEINATFHSFKSFRQITPSYRRRIPARRDTF